MARKTGPIHAAEAPFLPPGPRRVNQRPQGQKKRGLMTKPLLSCMPAERDVPESASLLLIRLQIK